jgi:hypothetical protein
MHMHIRQRTMGDYLGFDVRDGSLFHSSAQMQAERRVPCDCLRAGENSFDFDTVAFHFDSFVQFLTYRLYDLGQCYQRPDSPDPRRRHFPSSNLDISALIRGLDFLPSIFWIFVLCLRTSWHRSNIPCLGPWYTRV